MCRSFQWLVGLHPCAVWWAQPCLTVLSAAGPAGDWLLPLFSLSSRSSYDSRPWPAVLFLCIHHEARLSSLLTGVVLLPSAVCHALFCPHPCSACLCFSLYPPPRAWMSSAVAETPSQKKRTMCWVPQRRHQTLVKIVECNAKWWGFNSCAKCIRRQILQGKILSVF